MSQEKYFAIYSRKSKYTGKGESIENQIEMCKQYIKLHFGKDALNRIVIYEDIGFSGGNLNRPDFRRMMLNAKTGKIESIIVYRLDRISRNISDFSGLINELSDLEINFISIKEQFDTATPMGRAMMYISSVFSQLERETIAERIKDNMHELAKTGIWLGGVTPTGYRSMRNEKTSSNGNIKSFNFLDIVPYEAETVKKIFDIYLSYNSLKMVENKLNDLNIKTKNNKPFSRFSIKAILTNPVYSIADKDSYNYFDLNNAAITVSKEKFNGEYGIMPYNRTHQEKGKAALSMPINEWIISVGMHQGIVSGQQWVAVQNLLRNNKSKVVKRPRINESLLTDIIFCKCSSKMVTKLYADTISDGKRKFSYICKVKQKSKKSLCNVKNINGNYLDEIVSNNIDSIKECTSVLIEELTKSSSLFIKSENKTAAYYSKRIEKNKLKLKNLMYAYIDNHNINIKSEIENEIEQLKLEIEKLQNQLKKHKCDIEKSANTNKHINEIAKELYNFKNALKAVNINTRREAVQNIVAKVLWDGDCVTIYYNAS